MSETPRTDAFCDQPIEAGATGYELAAQWLELSRTLERELAARDAEVARLQSLLAELVACKDIQEKYKRMIVDVDLWAEDDLAFHKRWPIAWDAARAGLSGTPAPAQPEQRPRILVDK